MSSKFSFRIALWIFIAFTGLFCAGKPPIEEYNIARAAIVAAKEAGASEKAPGLWFRADESYDEARRKYKNHEYNAAKTEFIRATLYAEKAENAAKLRDLKSGDVE